MYNKIKRKEKETDWNDFWKFEANWIAQIMNDGGADSDEILYDLIVRCIFVPGCYLSEWSANFTENERRKKEYWRALSQYEYHGDK